MNRSCSSDTTCEVSRFTILGGRGNSKSSAPAMTTVTTVTTTVDADMVVKEAPVKPSLFAVGSSSAGGTDPTPCGIFDLTGSDFWLVASAPLLTLTLNFRKFMFRNGV
ncbi:hypothetical protein Tco_1128325 [Tanacetum coccineum]